MSKDRCVNCGKIVDVRSEEAVYIEGKCHCEECAYQEATQ